MRYNENNFLLNLPNTRNLSSQALRAYKRFIENIIRTPNNAEDLDLIDFKNKFIIYIIDNINKYGIDYINDEYFLLRKNLCLLREDVIKDNKDILLELITDKDKLIETITKLDSLYRFNTRFERIKIDNKYEEVKKEIKTYDLPLYIKEFNSKKDLIVGKLHELY